VVAAATWVEAEWVVEWVVAAATWVEAVVWEEWAAAISRLALGMPCGRLEVKVHESILYLESKWKIVRVKKRSQAGI